MDSFQTLLARLDPPLKHSLAFTAEVMQLELKDPSVGAVARRQVPRWQYQNPEALQVILLHAVNELRRKGSHAPLSHLPLIDGRTVGLGDL